MKLGEWHNICKLMLGETNPATIYFADKLAEQGDQEVIADDSQVLMLIGSMQPKDAPPVVDEQPLYPNK